MKLNLIPLNKDFVLTCLKEQYVYNNNYTMIEGFFDEESKTLIINNFVNLIMKMDHNISSFKVQLYRLKLKGILKYYKYTNNEFQFCNSLEDMYYTEPTYADYALMDNNNNFINNNNLTDNFELKDSDNKINNTELFNKKIT